MNNNNKRSWFIAPLVLALIVAAFYGLTKARPKPKPIVTQPLLQQEDGIPVTQARVKVGTVNDALGVTGQLAAESVVNLSTKVAGKVLYVAAQEGDNVRQGQVMVQLDDADARRQLDQAQAGVQQAQAGLQTANARLAQARTTNRTGDVQSQAAVAQAQAGLRSAQARLQEVRTGARTQERATAENQVAIAKANLDKAQSDFDRYNTLLNEGAVAAATVDIYRTTLNVAKSQYNSANQNLSLVREGSRTEEVRQAEAAVQQARQTLVNAQAGQENSVNRAQDVQAALATVAQARATMANAQAGVGIARQAVANFKIVAPRSGSVTARMTEPGQYANPGTPLMTIVDLSTVYLQADVSETDVQRVRQGQTVNVVVDALGNRVWKGRVESLVASADPQSRNFEARIAVSNAGRTLRPNMFARAEIVTSQLTNAIMVPRQAVVDRNGRSVVMMALNGKALEVPVSTGITSGDDIVVRSPKLNAASRIIVSGQQTLQPGQKVTTA